MSDSNKNFSDETMLLKSDNLSDASSDLTKSISTFGSINVSGSFSALLENGIATGLISSIDNAIKNINTSVLGISQAIQSLINEQQRVDKEGAGYVKNRTGFNNTTSKSSNYKNKTKYDETEKNELDDEFNNGNEEIDGLSDFSSNDTELENINKEDQGLEEYILTMNDYDQIELINGLINISNNNDLEQLLYDEGSASKLKEIFLENINVSDELKEMILELEPNILQSSIRNLLTNGNSVSDFSKFILTFYEENTDNSNISEKSSGLYNAYSEILNEDNLQSSLKDLYDGNTNLEEKSYVVDFTKKFVDLLAKSDNVTSEEILTNEKYKDSLSLYVSDLTKSFSYLSVSNKIGEAASNTLHSNILYKEY